MKKLIFILSVPILSYALTLSDLLNAIEKNELVSSRQLFTQAQKSELEATKSAYWPSLKAQGIYSYVPKEDRGFANVKYSNSITASMVLFDGFKRENLINSKLKNYEAQKAYSKQILHELSLKITILFFNLKSLQSSMKAAKQKIRQLAYEVKRLKKLFSVRSVRENELEEVKAALAMAEYKLTWQKQEVLSIKYEIQTLIDKKVENIEKSSFVQPQEDKTNTFFEIQAKEYETQALKYLVKAQTSSYWPTFLLKDTFANTQYYSNKVNFGGALSIPKTTNKIELVASITLFDFGTQSKLKQKLYLQHKAKVSQLAYKKREIEYKRALAKTQLVTAKAKIVSARLSMNSSKKSYKDRKKEFKASLLSSNIYLDALTRYFKAKALYEKSINDYEIAKAYYYFYHAINLKEKLQ